MFIDLETKEDILKGKSLLKNVVSVTLTGWNVRIVYHLLRLKLHFNNFNTYFILRQFWYW